jgi:hypothetical protein
MDMLRFLKTWMLDLKVKCEVIEKNLRGREVVVCHRFIRTSDEMGEISWRRTGLKQQY